MALFTVKKSLGAGCLLAMALSAQAGYFSGPWRVEFGVGGAQATAPKNIKVDNNGVHPEDTMTANNSPANGTVTIGVSRPMFMLGRTAHIGVQYNTISAQTISGMIDEYSNPHFYNYTYRYHVRRHTFLASYEIPLFRVPSALDPYIVAGLGVSLNTGTDYSQTPEPGIKPMDYPKYKSHTSTHFAYQVGFGFRYLLMKSVSLFAQYSYMHAGDVVLGKRAYASSSQPKQSLQYQSALFGIGYTF
jgi:opacity protein-like surface antigen